MIFIGSDIVEVNRFRKSLEQGGDRFLEKIFSASEIEYCINRMNPAMHFSGRFAAKEAVKKALMASEIIQNIPLKQIIINRRADGAPIVTVSGIEAELTVIQVSISHTEEHAISQALVYRP